MRMRPAAMTARTVVQPPACTRIANGPDEPCDCLCRCGDDPRLARGQAKPCEYSVAQARQLAEVARRMELQRDLADMAALRLARDAQPAVWADSSAWLDAATPPTSRAASQVAMALEYLLLRRLAERHPQHPNLVRISPAAPGEPQSKT
jgi:hypothetical protein